MTFAGFEYFSPNKHQSRPEVQDCGRVHGESCASIKHTGSLVFNVTVRLQVVHGTDWLHLLVHPAPLTRGAAFTIPAGGGRRGAEREAAGVSEGGRLQHRGSQEAERSEVV